MTRKFSTDNVRGVRDKYQVWWVLSRKFWYLHRGSWCHILLLTDCYQCIALQWWLEVIFKVEDFAFYNHLKSNRCGSKNVQEIICLTRSFKGCAYSGFVKLTFTISTCLHPDSRAMLSGSTKPWSFTPTKVSNNYQNCDQDTLQHISYILFIDL